MGCFLGCFGSSKDESKRRKNTHFVSHQNPPTQDVRNQYNPVYPTPNSFPNREFFDNPIDLQVPKSWNKLEDHQLSLGIHKKVTFDSDVKPEEHLSLGSRKKVTFDSDVKPEEQLSSGSQKKVTFDSDLKPEEQSSSGSQKKVSFDSNVKPEEQLSLETVNKVSLDLSVKPEEQLSSGIRKKVTFDANVSPEEQLSSGTRKRVTFDSNVKEYEHIPYAEPPENMVESEMGGENVVDECSMKPTKSSSVSEGSSTLSSLGSFPPNHRYQNCRESDDEDEELDCQVSDLDDDEDEDEGEDDEVYDDEYSDDEYHLREVQDFSCSSVESRTKSSGTCFVDDGHNDYMDHDSLERGAVTPVVFNRGARDRAGYVHSVLNPVENTAQWKYVKVKGPQLIEEQKENCLVDLSFQQSSLKSKAISDEPKHEVAVDASLSTWIVSSQKTPPGNAVPINMEPISSGASASSHGSNSVRSQEERPILGALTIEELKQLSATSSPRKSPSRSPDERPLLGTVGVHWNDRTPVEDYGSVSSFKGIPNTTSKYREDNRVNWHSTPFETRLERALNKGAAESHASRRVCL
ncbi:uncharacterized protein LOC110727997 isoform X2 [Chenopodium quinoa]|uniref:uncharacterized protein LOC110727997 isoform X2 n=1 Tax=Chenopodium quinoa TaxID=63459 RepID=UPI000B7756D9|nr:uncharacterized protein LOC110727997 isoform X2 [Chenopodium quinoa]